MNNENENLGSQTTPPPVNTIDTPIKRSRSLLYVLLAALLLMAGMFVVYEWQHKKVNNATASVAKLDSQISALNQQLNTASKASNSSQTTQPSATTVTETLDNGTKISYPLTSTNANVIWWSQDAYAPASSKIPPSGEMVLSDKRIVQYITSLPLDALQPSCTDAGVFTDTSIQMGGYNPKTKVFSHNQYANCINLLAGSAKYGAKAKQVLDATNADLEAFEKSITVVH